VKEKHYLLQKKRQTIFIKGGCGDRCRDPAMGSCSKRREISLNSSWDKGEGFQIKEQVGAQWVK
jgi:hypothetical protein